MALAFSRIKDPYSDDDIEKAEINGDGKVGAVEMELQGEEGGENGGFRSVSCFSVRESASSSRTESVTMGAGIISVALPQASGACRESDRYTSKLLVDVIVAQPSSVTCNSVGGWVSVCEAAIISCGESKISLTAKRLSPPERVRER
mmetsp:Transcript_4040/g.6263  ORF Transcript_4040/g.6263 Transcript_4040/m.6263 type:complete len:147 (+) Transcript_4040:398-838(+)|eukprot:CAMPEP_0185018534 /NCGR_PEP_ID=MMETSP1103-20130426/1226_1 /TAXON_ID=36769 /ORGANISM="Paraphysomonas bandaiensis, Strain Caron Lab Isolate" /LENGTH=146 /DNA_ID=CAMNT_0027548375 /DNA_START=355 /DNA_END=795 /DNA_ORIENTATION=-